MSVAKKAVDEEKDAKEEEEEELFVGDLVKISGVKADVTKALADVGLQWESSMSTFLGQTGRVKTVQMKEGKQLVEVQLGSADGPSFSTGVAALELLGDDEEEDEEDVDVAENEDDEAEEGHTFRVNEKVRDLTKPKGKCATGIVTKVSDQGTCDVKYDDGGTRTGIPLKQLRPLEKAESDGTGLSYTSSYNEFDFTTGQLPTGVEAVGEGVELKPGRGGETYLVMRKGTYLRLPFKGMRHERLRPGEAIPSYTLTLEFQLDGQHPQLEHPWSVYQASFPEVHETDELCFVSKARTEFPQWMVGTDIDGRLPVTLEMDPKSKSLCGLLPGTVVQQCGEVVRLPSGARRVPVKFKRQALTAVEEEEITSQKKKPASSGLFKAPPGPGGGFDAGKAFDLFGKGDEEEEEEAAMDEGARFGHKMNEDEVTITVYAGYWGESTQAGCATSIKVSSNGIARTLTFFPGVEHGAVRVEGEPDADLGFQVAQKRYHILSLTMRQTGTHTFSISDGGDPTNVWSMDFRLHGWLDDLYGAAAVSVFDPEDRELEMGHELIYQGEGEHKLRLVTLGDQVYETDELDPQGWVSFNRTCLEPVDKANTKASRHPTCHVKVKDKILDKRLFPGRWHSLTVTVDSVRDEMCVYLDGIAVDKPIDIFESFGMGRGGGGGREGGKDRRKGVSETGAAEYEAYSYGGFGYSFQSPFAVPQEGFLLFASSSIRSMPGGTKLRKAVFRNSILNAKTIEDQYVNSRHKRRAPPIPQSLTLAPLMKKKAIPLWIHGSYVAEFCNPFVPAAGGSPQHLYGVFCMALEATVEKMSVGKLWTASDISGCKKVLGLFREMDILMRKWHQLWTAPGDQLPGLSAIYLRRLAAARAELQPGGRLLVPLGIRLQKTQQMLMLIMERKASGNYRFLVVNSSLIGLVHHASDASKPPKIRYRTALELDDVPAIRAEDEGFWMMLVVTAVQPCHDQLPLYDKLLPWLAGSPLEHLLATASPSSPAACEWRSPQCADTDGWRYLTFSMRVLLLEVANLSSSKAKLLKWHMREQLPSFAATDLAQAQSLSVSEKRLLRLGLSQLALAAVKVSGNLELEGSKGTLQDAKETSMTVLRCAQRVVTDVEAAIERKPRPYGFEDPSVLPLLDLVQGASEAPAHDWGLHPFFERLLREQRSPGQKVGIPLLVPINLLEMPETIPDLEAAVRALRLTEELCAKLCFVGHERCKFRNFLRVALLQHVFTELMPLPLGPLAEKPPLNLTDPVWAPNGCDQLHPQLTRGGQLELMQVLLRLAEHFVSASCGLHASGSFDGVKIVVLGAIAAIADRVLRIRTVLPGIPKPKNDGPIEAEAEPNPSLVSDLINGVGNKGWKAMAVDPTSFMRQSETIEATPEISVARTAVASYFSEVKKALEVPSGKDRTLFDWDQHGWMLWVNKESGLKKLVQTICSHHLLQAGGGWADLAAGSDPYLVHTWPEFQCYRDIIFYWKYFLCTDLRVFPKVNEFVPQTAYLRWQVVDEQKAFGCPPNRGKVFMVTALGKDHLLKHDVPPHRPKPAASGLRWPSAALPSHHTKTPVRTEDDLLYMRSLPTFNEMLRASDSEALLSFLTVPYIRMPLVLAFFTTGDRVNSLFDSGLQQILQAVILEPGKLLEPMNWAAAPENVPANSSAEQELVASPYGQLLTELACAPGCLLAYLAKLLELALVLANSAMSQTVGTILFTLRVAARVESSAVYLLQHAEGKLPATGPRPGALPSSAPLLAELRAGRQRLRAIFMEAEGWLDAWLDELHDLACKAAAAAGEDLKSGGGAPKAKNKAAQSLDQYMKTSCNIHAHLLLLLRNVPEEELDERSVGRILSSFTFLSLHHTFNQNFLDIPETELFEVFQHHRRGLVRWFEKQRKNSEYGRFNRVLQQVHQQFSTIDSSSAVDTHLFEWGVVKGDARNAGRYAIVGPKRSDAERGEVAQTASNDNAWIELNIQLLQVTVRGRHVTPLEADTCDDTDFKEVLTNGAGRQAETVQCAALLSTNLVRVRELLSQPYRITRWEGIAAANLPFTGDYVRLYDMEDFEEHEAWVPQLFEPVRLKFFVPPAVPQNILFFLLEETDPSASVIVLAAVHPKVRGKVWKEVMVFRDLRAVQIFKIDSYGHQHYRSLEYTTNARYCLAEKQPTPNDRDDPWPDWGRYEAGAPDLNLQDKPPSVVMSRTIVKDVHSDGSAGAGSGKSDPLDDSDEWSDGEPSDDETEQEKKERTVWERSQKEGEQYLPKRFLKGLLPEGLLEKYFIYQENESPWRAIRGYPKTLEGEEDRDPDHILEIKLIKVGKVPSTGHRGWCALVRKRWKAQGRKPWFLLNLLYAKEGTPLHSMARTLVRLENLSFILAWTEQDPRQPGAGYDPPIHFVEMPRLLLSFTVKRAADGSRGLWSLDHAELSVPLGPPSFARTQAAKLLEPMPHSLLLQTSNQQYFALLPNIKVHRPHVGTDPFSTELVLERGNADWWSRAKNKTFLYPVHASRSFLQTPTLASALYVMMLRWMNRDYRGVASLVSAVGTDSKYEEDEMQIFKHLGRITDPHPDSHANRLQVSLAVSDANMELPWDLLEESAGYLGKLAHVTARSRLSEDYELRVLQLCRQIRKCLEIIEHEVGILRQRWWGQWGAARIKRFVELLQSEKERKLANFQEAQEVEQWLRLLVRKMRAAQLPQTKEAIRSMSIEVFGDYNVDPNVELALDNRSKYLERLGGRDGARPDEPLFLHCPHRAKESLWQTHQDQNVLLCSLFDLLWEVLGAEKVLRRDVEEEEGPEIPMMRRLPFPMAISTAFEMLQGKMSLKDYGSAPKTWAFLYSLFTCSTGARLSRAKETHASHQHTYSTLLLHLMPGSRHHGVLASLLHILAQNPNICESMPMLTKPKKVRLVGQWKLKLTEIHHFVVQAADAMQLLWPPTPESFQELPRPMQSKVDDAWFQRPRNEQGGLCCKLLFAPEIPAEGACLLGCPSLAVLNCTERCLEGTADLDASEAEALSTVPLRLLAQQHLVETPPSSLLPEEMPFDLANHPTAKHRVAISMLSRLDREVKLCARMRNARQKPTLTSLQSQDVKAIANGDAAALAKARDQMARLREELLKLKSKDEEFVAMAINKSFADANDIDLSPDAAGPPLRDRLRFWLLRHTDLEATLWFEHLCCGLLSPEAEADFAKLNPFLKPAAAAGLLSRLTQMMLVAGRIIQTCRALDSCQDLSDLLANPDAAGSAVALAAGLGEKANVLSGLLASKRTYINRVEGSKGFKGVFDPHYLVFEFVTGFLLRPRQVEMVNEFSDALRTGKSSVKQMIMGAGKTSVVSPLLALMHANGSRIVCLVVPPALISLSRSVLQNCFSTVVQKRVSTFKCDRSLDLEVALSERLGRIVSHGDVLLTTPGDVKSLELRFLEQLDLANDRQARRNTTQMRRECVQMGRALELMKQGVCMIDEVDLVLHPLRSELNFPIGPKNLIEHAPDRWRVVLHLLDGFFSVEKGRVPPHLKDSLRAKEILQILGEVIHNGADSRYLQRNPHLILLNEEFYHHEVKPIMCDWLMLWLSSEHVGRAFEQPSGNREDRGLTEDEVRAYLLHRVTPQRLELEAPMEVWQAVVARAGGGSAVARSNCAWIADVLNGALGAKAGPGRLELPRPEGGGALGTMEPVARSDYFATRLAPKNSEHVRLLLEETEEGAAMRGERVEKLPAKDAKSMNLSWDWLQVYLPFSLQKIDRVTFGIMSSEQVAAALAEQPLMPLTRAKLAIPFVGKDVPSQSSEFAHPDVVIGLTTLAYRYEGLRREDFDEVLGMLCDRLEAESGAVLERPTSLLWKNWVEESGADFCVKQAELDEQTSSQVLGLEEGGKAQKPDRLRPRVLPLHLLERRNEANMAQLFQLLSKLPSAVHFYLEQSVFPQFMRFQDEKLSASGQDLGGSILFGQRIGFSGTPSDLMPRELGQCDYEPGSEGEMVSTMTDTKVVTFEAIEPGWNVELLLDSIIEASHQGRCNALIDTGALITGFTNQEVAEYLLGFGPRSDAGGTSPSARSPPSLPDTVDGVVFLDDDGGKKILLRATREVTKLADSGVPAQRRFAFYDQVHTTGMDIQHKLDAVAALTLGKDMCWRDYVQGAYRMRGIGRGQRICLYVIPEVVELISRDLVLAGIEDKLHGPDGKWTTCERGRLLAVAAWLLVNSIRTERIQFAMLQLQNLGNVWRRNAFKTVMQGFEMVTSEGLKEAVQVFKEPIAFTLPSGVPKARGVHEVVQDRVEEMSALIAGQEDEDAVAEVKKNVLELSALADEKEGEAGLETEQQREQEQERQQEQEQEEEKEQEIEIEKFVDLMHCRDDEEPESWPLISLASQEKAKQFYEAQRFKLWKRRPLENLPEEARISNNWFNPQWSGFRRVKNVFVQMEWVPDMGKALRCKEPLQLDPVEELEMHKKLRTAWDLLMRGEGIELPREAALVDMAATRSEHGKKLEKLPPPPGELGAERLMELLAASFDWDASLRDPKAALAYLGRKPEEKLNYEDMVRLLLDARFRTRDEGRSFVLLSLAEAETLRRVLHARLQEKEPILKQAPSASLALRCVFAGNAVLDGSLGFQPGPTFQCRMMHQLARFLDGQSFFRPPEISVLLRALQRNRPFERRRFFEGLGGCRRRGAAGGWEQQPVAEVLRPWLEFEQVLARVRAVRLHAAIYGQGLSVQMAFQRYDVNQSGLLEPMELCRALRELGFAFDAFEVANWIEAVDTTGNHCADYSEFFAFCKLQVDSLLGIGFAPKAALAVDATQLMADRPPSAEVVDGTEGPSQVESANPRPHIPGPPELIRHTSDIVRPDEIEEELLERRAAQKRQEAEEARAKAEVEEAIEVLVEEELGMNPTFGEGFGEWDFRGQLLPKDTFALGVVDLIPESWGTKGGKNFLLFDQRAGLAVQRIQLAPNGNSERRINKYSLTLWFRTPMLPSKADRMLLLDLPRGEMESEEETTTGGSSSVFVWRGGVVAPEGYHEPSLQKKDSDASSHLRQMMNGEWRLKFQGGESGEKEKKVEMMLSLEPSGRLLLSPSRGAASRKSDAAQRNCFGVRLKLQKEVRDYVELHCNNIPPENFQQVMDNLWQKIRSACNAAMEGRSWQEIGWPGSQNQVKRKALKDLKSRGDVLIARGLPALDALRIARGLKEHTDAGAEFVEDKSMANEIKIGDMVQRVATADSGAWSIPPGPGGGWDTSWGGSGWGEPSFNFGAFNFGNGVLKPGEAGKVTNVNFNRGQVHVEGKKGSGRWFSEDEVMKVDPKALGLVPLTDSEWAGLPSTRANYVSFSQQLPNPLLEGGWVGKGRAEKSEETSAAEIDLNFDVVQMGFMSSYVDAQVFYAEAGLEIRGEWRTADGSVGKVMGTKALAGLALGGLWHLELQSGAESMQHAWNCWFSSFPPSSGSNTSTIQVSGSALAGPMLQEGSAAENAPPALHITGEMTGKGLVSFTMNCHDADLPQLEGLGAKNWIGSTWEGELGTDRWLRGAWRCGASSGRWRARHIGRQAVHQTLKPMVDSGAEWEPKRCEIRSATAEVKTGLLKKGMKVKLSKVYKTCSDAQFGPLKEGMTGVVTQENQGSDQPLNIKAPNGQTWWYQEKALVPAFALQDDSRLFNPLGDEFEGVSFTRFPVTQGSAYVEVRVVRTGRTMPMLGFGLMEEKDGKTILVRMAIIEGRSARKLDLTGRPQEVPELQRSASKDSAGKKAAAKKKGKSAEEEDEKSGFDLFGGGEESDEPEEQAEEPPEDESKKKKGWDYAKPYGDRWQEGDVICCQLLMPSGIIAFGLNGDFQAPMGTAFDLKLPPGSRLCLMASAGENGRLRVNMGQVAFSFPPPSQLEPLLPEMDDDDEEKEGEEAEAAKAKEDPDFSKLEPINVPASMGLGESMHIRPLWQVKLPKAVKAWPVYALPSRDSQGRRAMKDGEMVEQIALHSGGGWVQHQAGWSPCKMVVVGHEYEALKPTPAWVGIDKQPKEKVRKAIKRVVHASFDTELCSQHCWNFRGSEEAHCSNGPNMLVSMESAASGILRWCIKSENGNKSIEVGVVPAEKAEEGNFLFESCDCGVKSSGTKGGSDKKVFDIYQKYIEVIADLDVRQLKVMVGDSREQMVEVKSADIPFEEDIKLAITGWNNTKVRLEPPQRDKAGDSDESEGEEEDEDGLLVTSCGNAVQASTWHVATLVVDLPASTFKVYLDGEMHLNVRDPGGLMADGRFSIDPREGMMLFSAAKRGGSGLGSADWRAGGHLRSMRLDTKALSQFDVWAHQLPKGVWICRCTARNAADARVCWRCRNTKTRSGQRPPGDADPRVEGLTVVTADSFRELVLDSQKHVLLVASASWCPPCQQLKPMIHRLAQLLSAEPQITVGVIDTDENELQSRYFPEPHIPNVKFFLQGKKRQPVSVQNAPGMSLDELAGLIEQHTGISIQQAIEKGFPAYAERVGVHELLKKLKTCALTKPIARAPGQPALKSLASFLYNELITGCKAASPQKLSPPGPPPLQRAISAKTSGPAAPPQLMRAVSGGNRAERRPHPMGYTPTLMMGIADPRLTERLVEELEKHLLQMLRVAQPEDFKSFLTSFLLRAACPSYSHSNFYNAMSRVSWQVPPMAEKLVATTRIFRFLLRWCALRRRLGGLPPLSAPWAPPAPQQEMSAAAQRHSWRRIEIALANEEDRHGLAELGLLLDRGLPPDTAPFGLTPLLLAAAIGHLPATQFLYVRGASPHVSGGQPPILPVEAAARHNHLRIVEFLMENGSVGSRALHYASAGGASDVANYLLSKGCSADATVQGLSPVAVALISRQHSLASLLLPQCDEAALAAPLSDEGCTYCGLASGSTLAHLAGSVGGLCEQFVLGLLRVLPPATAMQKNSRNQTPLDLMPSTLRIAVKPQLYAALGAASSSNGDRREAVAKALKDGKADPSVTDPRGFVLLNLSAYAGEEDMVELLLDSAAKQLQNVASLSALMWAHWCGHSNIVLKLTSKGASLSNADLEGLQRLRACAAELEDKEKGVSGSQLLWPEMSQIWPGCWPAHIPAKLSPSTNTYLYSARPLLQRMTWGVSVDHGTAMPPSAPSTGAAAHPVDEDEKTSAAQAAKELLNAIKLSGAEGSALATAQLMALRLTAEGKVGLSAANIVALNLFLSDVSFHSECSSAFTCQFSQSPAPALRERAADLHAAHAELSSALQALPARKVVCFRALRVPGSSLRDVLRGHRLGMDCYRPGSIVMWRQPTSCTQDPSLAEELALHGEPSGACGVVFKIRRTASARPVADFSTCPEHQEVLFPAGSIFRVLGFYACNSQSLRKGTGSDGQWSAELGSSCAAAAQSGDALTWEEVCRSRSAMVLLDEEDAAVAVQRTELMI